MKEENNSPDGPTPGDDFRNAVKSMLDSPDKPGRRRKIAPSPRVDRITIQDRDKEIEFLIAPKRISEPMEIREQIRSALSFTDEPTTTLNVPMKDGATGLWSPAVPGYDYNKEERIVKQLIGAIFCILTAVFCVYFQEEIMEGMYAAFAWTSEFAANCWAWLSGNASTVWNMITDAFSSLISDEGATVDGEAPEPPVDVEATNMDDSVTR